MKVYKTIVVPATKKEVVIKRKCDLCGKESKSSDWSGGSYEIDETEISVKIKQREGSNYPECGMGTEYEIDLCPDCFTQRLVPWLKGEGADIKEVDWDY